LRARCGNSDSFLLRESLRTLSAKAGILGLAFSMITKTPFGMNRCKNSTEKQSITDAFFEHMMD
jgi:hypothetical protein